MPVYITALSQFHHGLRLGLLIRVTSPCTEEEDDADLTCESVNKDGIEGCWRVCSNESSGYLHTEEDEDDIGPVTVLALPFEVLLVCHVLALHHVSILITKFRLRMQDLACFWVHQPRSVGIIILSIIRNILRTFCLGVLCWFQSGNDIPGVVTEVGQFYIMHHF